MGGAYLSLYIGDTLLYHMSMTFSSDYTERNDRNYWRHISVCTKFRIFSKDIISVSFIISYQQ